jgi:hypothetical protein
MITIPLVPRNSAKRGVPGNRKRMRKSPWLPTDAGMSEPAQPSTGIGRSTWIASRVTLQASAIASTPAARARSNAAP